MSMLAQTDTHAAILDQAAALFARRGFDQVSMQEIADAAQRPRSELIEYFPSKFTLYEAAIETLRIYAREVLEHAAELPVGRERDRVVVEAAIQFTFDWPGISAFSSGIADCEPEGDPQLVEIGMIVYQALGIDLANLDMERIVRVSSAFTGLGMTSLQAVRTGLTREWRGHIAQAAMDALRPA
ncbi:hypothetical protein LMG26846_01164 [Achromobacter insuavis]|nr:TetR/AcrR family transcriptional regulator [Achromobacter insuavis]CAB3834911.1 hypothetical protein LMG26846_01164 [Achromobacter insuavis]